MFPINSKHVIGTTFIIDLVVHCDLRTYQREADDDVWLVQNRSGDWIPEDTLGEIIEELWQNPDPGFNPDPSWQPPPATTVFSELGTLGPPSVQVLEPDMMDTGPLHIPRRPWWKIW